jgi:hypothetical protein
MDLSGLEITPEKCLLQHETWPRTLNFGSIIDLNTLQHSQAFVNQESLVQARIPTTLHLYISVWCIPISPNAISPISHFAQFFPHFAHNQFAL